MTIANKIVMLFILEGTLSTVSKNLLATPLHITFFQNKREDLCPNGQNWCEVEYTS